MKYLVFVRGEDSEQRKRVVDQTMRVLNPDINTVRAIRVAMSNYGTLENKEDRKAAASSVKNMVRRLLAGSHQEQFIVVDNANLNERDWVALFNIADAVNQQVCGIGIDVCKNEQSDLTVDKNENDPNMSMFKAMMYKYIQVENEQDANALSTILLGLCNEG